MRARLAGVGLELVRATVLPELSNGQFVQFAYERVLRRGALAGEVAQHDHELRCGDTTRVALVQSLLERSFHVLHDRVPANDPTRSWVMGTERTITAAEWFELRKDAEPSPPRPRRTAGALRVADGEGVVVTAIASMYRGGPFIESFLENVTAQTIFDRCELIIVDAASPDGEREVIDRYRERFANIVHHRCPTRIGIYAAWNLGVRLATGRYLTSTNLDDLRREDSFERQAEILDTLPFVDCTYQDVFYSFDAEASFGQIEAIGVHTDLPIVTPYNLMRFNAPHNAPMWRRSVHDELGMFDESLCSAGDAEFWLRCLAAGKVFYKRNDPHVGYFVNPQGISTRPTTEGLAEHHALLARYAPTLNSAHLVGPDEQFLDELEACLGAPGWGASIQRTHLDWRYAAVQRALRAASVGSRPPRRGGER